MAGTRSLLERAGGHLEESMGVREQESQPRLSPVPHSRDISRRPLRNIGQVDIDLVLPDPDQPRSKFSEEALDRLARSIRDKGQLSPIRVRWSEALAKWIIISGERRWRATKRAGLATIECYFHEGELGSSEILEQQLIENLLREDLQPIEEARAFATLMQINNWTGKQLSDALRIAPSQVTRAIAMLKLPADLQIQVEAGELSPRSAYEISKLADVDKQRALATQASAGRLTHTDAAKAVRQRQGRPLQKPRGTKQTFVTPEGWKISVAAKRKGNYHEIEQALTYALEEVRLRIQNNVQVF